MKKDNMLVIIMSQETTSSKVTEDGKIMVPLYNIPMMSDEEWERLAASKRNEE